MGIIYLFIDGIGIGIDDPGRNPFSRYARHILQTCSGRLYLSNPWKSMMKIYPLDAHMGIPGIPQSATNQTSLWTGINAPRVLGYHVTGFPGPKLKKIIYDLSIIKVFKENRYKATFVNAYTPRYLKKLEKLPRFASVSTHIQKASGQEFFTVDDILQKRAIYMDITNQIMHEYYPELKDRVPVMDPYTRGADLAEISRRYDLVIFEYFLSDKAGHSQSFDAAKYVIQTLETFIKGIVDAMETGDTLLVVSDHGNLEDLSIKTHTENLVPLLVAGGLKNDFRNIFSLFEVPLRIYEIFGIPVSIDEEYYIHLFSNHDYQEEMAKNLTVPV